MPSPLLRRSLLLILLAAFAARADAAAASALPLNPYGGLIVPPIDWSGQAGPPRTGEFTEDLKIPPAKGGGDPQGGKANQFIMHYRIYVPKALPDRKTLGLILCFHGSGGNEDHVAPWVHETFKGQKLADNYIIIGLKSAGAAWDNGDEEPVLKTVDWLRATYPIDPRRMFTLGHSNGSWMSFNMSSKHLELFAGGVRFAGYGDRLASLPNAAQQTEFYMVHGDNDSPNPVDNTRKLRGIMQKMQYRYVYRELHGHDHGSIIGVLPVRNDIAHWIDALRHKQMPLAADEEKFIRQFAQGKKADELYADPAAWTELERIAGPQGAAALARAFKSEDAKIREAAAMACTRADFDFDVTLPLLIRLCDDKEATVRQAALKALAMAANWRNDIAQQALVHVAMKRKADADDRARAVAGLANTATLPLLGNYDDDTTDFMGLLSVLNEEEQALRVAAFAPLQVAVKDGLGYDPAGEAKARKDPLMKWHEWFVGHMLTGEAKGKMNGK